MDIVWKYKIDVADQKIFEELEQEQGIVIPEALKSLILEANAATPSKCHFVVEASEHILGAVLSFNRDEEDTDTIFTALTAVADKNLLPFAIDPFGNYICLDLKKGDVIFWDHETGNASIADTSLPDFLAGLY